MPNGCPYNRPEKCANGGCVHNMTLCAQNNTFNCSNSNDFLCPDGSCV
jgi:hypothetical protein